MPIIETWYYDEDGTYLLSFQAVDEYREIMDNPPFEVDHDTWVRWSNAESAFFKMQDEIKQHLKRVGHAE
jgi:hypothetical protein